MNITILNKKNFNEEVINANQPVLIDFWASWCGPCRMLSPTIEKIANEREDIKVCKVNVDDEMELSQQFEIMSIPTLLYFKNGEIIKRVVGVVPKNQIEKIISE